MSKLPSERINEIYVEMAKEKGLNPSSSKANPLINLAIIMYLDETAKEKECESKDTFKKEYRVIDKAPRWVTFNLSTGDFETEPYTHQDENFSNMCGLSYCRCQS